MRTLLYSLGLLASMALTGIESAIANPSMSVNVMQSANSLILDGEGQATTHVVKVATITLSTDSNKGFTVTIGSGNLTKASLETPISYQVITVISTDNPPSSGDFTVASGNNYTFVTNQAGSQNRDLYILYTPANFQDPGAYSANIMISILDNP